MCIILFQPAKTKGVALSREQFQKLSESNGPGDYVPNPEWNSECHWTVPQGIYTRGLGPIGLMYPNGRSIKVVKTADGDGHDAIYEKYAKLAGRIPVAIHIRSHGKGDLDNTQPFVSSNGIGYMLNGSVPFEDEEENMSDARVFAKKFLPLIDPEKVMRSKAFKGLLSIVGEGSAMLFMNAKGQVRLVNSEYSDSAWHEGVWYSHRDDL